MFPEIFKRSIILFPFHHFQAIQSGAITEGMDASVNTKTATTSTAEYSVSGSLPNSSASPMLLQGGATTSHTQSESLLVPAPLTTTLTKAQQKAKAKDERDRDLMNKYAAGLIDAPDIDLTSSSSSNKGSEHSQDSNEPRIVGQRKLSVVETIKGQIEVINIEVWSCLVQIGLITYAIYFTANPSNQRNSR